MHLQMTYFAGKIPSMQLLDEPDVTVVRSHIPDDMFNYVLAAHFTPENTSARIDQVIWLFKKQCLPFSWWIGPSDTPVLLQRGKGYGTAMMEHLLKGAKKKGYVLAGLEASHEGLSLYKRLGFKEICTFNEYVWTG